MEEIRKSVVINGQKIFCNMQAATALLGGKWKPLLLWHISRGAIRFGELRKTLEGISPRILSKELKELEREGLVVRTEYPAVPPKVEYALTELGNSIVPVLNQLCDWGSGFMNQYGKAEVLEKV